MQQDVVTARQRALETRVDGAGWGLFLIVVGGVWLAPESMVPDGTVMLAAGLTLAGLSLVRHLKRLPVSGFLTVLGVVLALVGAENMGVVQPPLIPLTVIVLGAGLVARSLVARDLAQ